MAANAFIFLERNRDTDSERLGEAIDYYSDLNMNYQVGYGIIVRRLHLISRIISMTEEVTEVDT